MSNRCQLLSNFIIAAVFSLAGCGNSEPTEAEMFAAMSSSDRSSRMFGDITRMKAEAKKASCERIAENAYKCGIASKDGKGMVLPPLRFTKIDGKWQLAL